MDFVNTEKTSHKKADIAENTNEDPMKDENSDDLFSCPEEGCVCTFQRYYNLEHHLSAGKCKLLEKRNTLLDKANILNVEKLSEGSITSSQPSMSSSVDVTSNNCVLTEGWALKASKKFSRFNNNQKQYLDDKFILVQETGCKADPENVAQDMRHARNKKGERRFTVDEFLTPQQIKYYFSRKAAKQKKIVADEVAMEDEAAYSSARESILQECQLKHPITYDTYNICQLHATDRLKKLNFQLLRCICDYFHFDVSQLSLRRKKPYLDLISDLVTSCTCNAN